MHIWGLHIIDVSIVAAFLIAILIVGVWVSRTVKHESDFFLGGRKMGKTLQFFLAFGNASDSNGAVQISSGVFSQGMGGIWLNFQSLFITPFFWFTQVWFRRIRLTTMADLFVDRFNSKTLATAYAAFSIIIALLTLGTGNLGTYKVTAAMMVKPPSEYTQEDKIKIQQWSDYKQLQVLRSQRKLTDIEQKQWEQLDGLAAQLELKSYITYLQPVPFYIAYSVVIAIYIVLGGLKAAAVTDTIQGLLILAMSILMIPLGLKFVGGVTGLHAAVPEWKFELFGTAATMSWYAIAAITFTSLIQIFGLMHNMSIGGSAKDEDTARFGMITGGFVKRFVLMGWAFCGLLAIAILTGDRALSEPDGAWGQLSLTLLPKGLLGIMLAGLLLGHMPAVGVACVSVSGLFTRNVYRVLFPGRSDTHYTRVGQVSIGVILILAILIATSFTGVLQILTEQIAFNAYFGAAVLLVFFWRRLTATAILMGVAVWVILLGVIPWTVPHIASFRENPNLLLMTEPRTAVVAGDANALDVAEGRATALKQPIRNSVIDVPQQACFFDRRVRSDITDPTSAWRGDGRFQVEVFIVHLLGVPVEKFNRAGLLTTRWLFDGILPFGMMIIFSLFTKPAELDRINRFYVKLKTPVAPTPELDHEEVQKSFENPHRFDDQKLLPGSNWEFTKWTRKDVIGFFGCWGMVAVILGILWLILNTGRG